MQMVGANTSARTLVDPMSARVTRDTFYRMTTRLVQQHPQVTRQPVWLALVRPARPIPPLPFYMLRFLSGGMGLAGQTNLAPDFCCSLLLL